MILLQWRLILPLIFSKSCMKKAVGVCSLFFLLFFQFTILAADTTIVRSPSGNISFRLFSDVGQLNFNISSGPTALIENSKIIMSLDGEPITNAARIGKVALYKHHETYPWMGAHSTAIDQCNGAKISISHNNEAYFLEVRVFDDGAAFRLIVPAGKESGNRVAHIPDEATTFKLPSGSAIWYHDMYMHYEGVHTKKNIDSVIQGEWVAPPATFKLPQGIYASITEADLKNYGGCSFQADGKNGLMIRLPQHQPTSYPYRLRYSAEDTTRLLQP